MKFPLDISKQKHCPICKKRGAGLESEESAPTFPVGLSFLSMPVAGRTVDSSMMLNWDSGITKHPQSRATLGAAFFVAKQSGDYNGFSQLHVAFCSTRCLRTFFMDAVDQLERRVKKVMPEVEAAKKSAATRTRRTKKRKADQ